MQTRRSLLEAAGVGHGQQGLSLLLIQYQEGLLMVY
jgi:hypothetical protein